MHQGRAALDALDRSDIAILVIDSTVGATGLAVPAAMSRPSWFVAVQRNPHEPSQHPVASPKTNAVAVLALIVLGVGMGELSEDSLRVARNRLNPINASGALTTFPWVRPPNVLASKASTPAA